MEFTYRAKKDLQTEASGVVEAVDISTAVTHLRRMGLYPMEVVPLEKKGARAVQGNRLQRRLSRAALALWARTVADGLAAGLSLTQALHLLTEQEKGRPAGDAAALLEEKVTAGEGLAEAMDQMGALFPPVATHLVRAGEGSGSLEQVLQALAGRMEKETELVERVRGALVYPLFVLTVGFGTVALFLWMVVPQMAILFAETGQSLPWGTRLLMGAGRFFFWALLAAVAGAAAALFGTRRGWWQIPLGRWGGHLLERLPALGPLARRAEIARLSSTLGLLLEQGLPLPEALRLAAGTVGRERLRQQVLQTVREVMEGMSFSASMRRVGIDEPFLQTMVAVGEAQGDLGGAFTRAGVRYHQEVDRTIRVVSGLLEPALILLVGFIVGGIVFSMILPVFEINFAG